MKINLKSVVFVATVFASGALAMFGSKLINNAPKYQFVARAEISEYKVTVDYGLTLRELIDKSGCFVNPDVVGNLYAGPDDSTGGDLEGGKRFPVHGSGQKQVILAVVHFDHFISNDIAVHEMVERGLRPATMQELLAFAAAYPHAQEQFPIVGLGSVVEDGAPLIPGGHAYTEKVSPELCTWDIRHHNDVRGVGLTSFKVPDYEQEYLRKHESEWKDRFLAVRD